MFFASIYPIFTEINLWNFGQKQLNSHQFTDLPINNENQPQIMGGMDMTQLIWITWFPAKKDYAYKYVIQCSVY